MYTTPKIVKQIARMPPTTPPTIEGVLFFDEDEDVGVPMIGELTGATVGGDVVSGTFVSLRNVRVGDSVGGHGMVGATVGEKVSLAFVGKGVAGIGASVALNCNLRISVNAFKGAVVDSSIKKCSSISGSTDKVGSSPSVKHFGFKSPWQIKDTSMIRQ